jgi:hypothetical protein
VMDELSSGASCMASVVVTYAVSSVVVAISTMCVAGSLLEDE